MAKAPRIPPLGPRATWRRVFQAFRQVGRGGADGAARAHLLVTLTRAEHLPPAMLHRMTRHAHALADARTDAPRSRLDAFQMARALLRELGPAPAVRYALALERTTVGRAFWRAVVLHVRRLSARAEAPEHRV